MSNPECQGGSGSGKPTCRECIEFLDDYMEGRLPVDQAAVFDVHLNRCPPCKDYVLQYKATIAAAKGCAKRSVEDDPPSAEVSEKLVKAIVEAMKKGGCGGG